MDALTARPPPMATTSPLHHQQLSPSLYRSDTPQPLSLKIEKPTSYGSPPPVAANHPDNNVCKMIEYRGAKVAAFMVEGRELVCLPQAFDLFLKHLVGGLHTVYTKLKRLEITPVVCNVEQVRILRGLGAIQPGVNRCKLISCKEFDILYEDCTNSSARPGRPPKRSPLLQAHPDTLEKLKKSRMESDYLYGANRLLGYLSGEKAHSMAPNGYHHYPPHLSMLPFMPMSYPAMTSATSMVMGNPHLGVGAIDGPVLKERNGDEVDSISPRSHSDHHEENRPPAHHVYPHHHPALEAERERQIQRNNAHDKESGISTASDMSMHGPHDYKKYQLPTAHAQQNQPDDLTMDDNSNQNDNDSDGDDEDSEKDFPVQSQEAEKFSSKPAFPTPHITAHDLNGPSSLEALLLNIQGLLKVAAEHAKQKERQVQYESAELKVEIMRERELRESLERRLMEEKRVTETFQKRWRKEKKARRRLEEQMEVGSNQCRDRYPNSSGDEGIKPPYSEADAQAQQLANVYADHVSGGPFVAGTTNQTTVIHPAIKTNG